jgi:tRNA pseudouridine55 synthase
MNSFCHPGASRDPSVGPDSGVRRNDSRRPRIERRAVHGVLLLDKPLGLSSNDALQKAKRLYRAEKAGHTGTLDPLATGLLPICFGAATKFSQASLDADKAYRASLALGATTSTGDGEGSIVRERPVAVSRAQAEAVCHSFVGAIEQLPPMHSALKHEGRALYDYARAGIDIERAPRRVSIRRIDIVEWQERRLVIDVACSKGTYIRTLAEDIGEALGCGAHLGALRRTASGALSVDRAVTLEALAAMSEAERDAQLLRADALLADVPEIRLDEADAGRFLTGLRRRIDAADADRLRVYGPQPRAFLGSAHITGGELIADRLLSPIEVQALIAS